MTSQDTRVSRLQHLSSLLGGAVVLLGVLVLLDVLGWNLHIDELLASEPSLSPATSHPGRMAPNTALCFLLFGVALLTLELKTKLVGWPAQYLALLAVVDMLESDGVIRQVALAHVDARQEALARSLAERHRHGRAVHLRRGPRAAHRAARHPPPPSSSRCPWPAAARPRCTGEAGATSPRVGLRRGPRG
jgi:hypothetical protein